MYRPYKSRTYLYERRLDVFDVSIYYSLSLVSRAEGCLESAIRTLIVRSVGCIAYGGVLHRRRL